MFFLFSPQGSHVTLVASYPLRHPGGILHVRGLLLLKLQHRPRLCRQPSHAAWWVHHCSGVLHHQRRGVIVQWETRHERGIFSQGVQGRREKFIVVPKICKTWIGNHWLGNTASMMCHLLGTLDLYICMIPKRKKKCKSLNMCVSLQCSREILILYEGCCSPKGYKCIWNEGWALETMPLPEKNWRSSEYPALIYHVAYSAFPRK